ncbi:MAG: TrkA family potassium uptake protein [Anaerolineae bacterium]|jgi:trk system potassium uptake protein TrkA|nr:TrkA family potassium uptake protein [Anaerolineae bacterium]MDX9832289.1 TrkA family potassium uptake protein [Anaerolineae bacterium]
MFVLIAGGGRTASQLANLLLGERHDVRVIEPRDEVLAHLHRELPTEAILVGDPTYPHVLEQAGIGEAQVLAACMPRDADNLVLCFLARSRYQVPRTIAQVNNPRNAWLFDEKFHVDVALNQSEILSRLIEEEMSLGDMMTLLKLRRGEYSVVEEKIPPGARAVGKSIQELELPERCIIAAIIRKGEMVVPRGATILEQGDEVLAVADRQGAEKLAALLAPPAGFNSRPARQPEKG